MHLGVVFTWVLLSKVATTVQCIISETGAAYKKNNNNTSN